MTRRDILKFSTLTAATLFGGCAARPPEPAIAEKKAEPALPARRMQVEPPCTFNFAALPQSTGKRVVIVGGGWSGLTVAKYMKVHAPDVDVILVEKRAQFLSSPASNLWLVGEIDYEFLVHDYLQAARLHGYHYFNATATGVDKANRVLKTSDGDIAYDALVLAPGIAYDYEHWTSDIALQLRLKTEYPAGYIPGSEQLTIRNKLHGFEKGVFVLSVPEGNYRCLSAPYERACLIAGYFQKTNKVAKVLLLDENTDIRVHAAGFADAFNQRYRDYIDYRPNSRIAAFDLDGKTIRLQSGETIAFDDAAFYPPVRGNELLEQMQVATEGMNRYEGDSDFFTSQVKGHPEIFITGDARSTPIGKSMGVAYSEGRYVAKFIASRLSHSREFVPWEEPVSLCYSVVSVSPLRAMYSRSRYSYDRKERGFIKDEFDINMQYASDDGLTNGKMVFEWLNQIQKDIFG